MCSVPVRPRMRLPALDAAASGVPGLPSGVAVELEHRVAAEHQRVAGADRRDRRGLGVGQPQRRARAGSIGGDRVLVDAADDHLGVDARRARSVASRAGDADARTKRTPLRARSTWR